MSLGVGFDVLKAHTRSLSLSAVYGSECNTLKYCSNAMPGYFPCMMIMDASPQFSFMSCLGHGVSLQKQNSNYDTYSRKRRALVNLVSFRDFLKLF